MRREAGIVLCGGRSSRMGQPKAWLPFGDESFLQRVVRIVASVVQPIVVVAAPEQALPTLPDSIIVAHDRNDYLGPLNGLATGLAALQGIADVAYLTSCDVPFLRPAFVRRVVDRLGPASICMPEADGYRHPLASAYRVDLLPVVQELIGQNRLRPVFLADAAPCQILTPADFADVDRELLSLQNINTPDDYQRALDSFHSE